MASPVTREDAMQGVLEKLYEDLIDPDTFDAAYWLPQVEFVLKSTDSKGQALRRVVAAAPRGIYTTSQMRTLYMTVTGDKLYGHRNFRGSFSAIVATVCRQDAKKSREWIMQRFEQTGKEVGRRGSLELRGLGKIPQMAFGLVKLAHGLYYWNDWLEPVPIEYQELQSGRRN